MRPRARRQIPRNSIKSYEFNVDVAGKVAIAAFGMRDVFCFGIFLNFFQHSLAFNAVNWYHL